MPDTLFQKISADDLHPVTLKKPATADVIRADLQERIDRAIARNAKLDGCLAPEPRAIPPRDSKAPNWTVDGFSNLPSGCFGDLVKIVDQARLEYDLVA